MIDLFQGTSGDDLPEFINVTYEQVQRHWDEWLVWRNVGHHTEGGGFEPSISYLEAVQSVPQEQLMVFFELDNLYGKMLRQYIKQTGGKK